jgi:hypothetical protein
MRVGAVSPRSKEKADDRSMLLAVLASCPEDNAILISTDQACDFQHEMGEWLTFRARESSSQRYDNEARGFGISALRMRREIILNGVAYLAG